MTGEEGTKVSLNESTSSSSSHNHGFVNVNASSLGASNDELGSNNNNGHGRSSSILVHESVSSNSDSPNNNNHLKEFSKEVAAHQQQSNSQGSSSSAGVLSDIEVKRRNGRLNSRDDEPLGSGSNNGSCGFVNGPPELSEDELAEISKERLQHLFLELQQYIRVLKKENAALKESDEKNRAQQQEYSRRENSLFVRLSTKEQEVQEYASQLSELKTSYSNVTSGGGGMRSSLLDPAVNLIIQKMKKELEETKKKLDDTQNDLNAWKFTPDSNTGKRLMAKCRMLYQENEELGKMITSGRLAKLESDLALQKSLTEEMKKSQSEMDECIQDLDEDVDGMHSTVCFYQKKLADIQLGLSTNNASNSASNNSLTNSRTGDDDSVVLQNVLISDLCETCRTTQSSKNNKTTVSTNHPQLKLESGNDPESSDDGLSRTNSHENNERTLVVMNNGEDAVQNDSKEGSVLNVQKNQCHLSTKRSNDTDTEKEYNGEASPPPSKRTKLTNYTKQQQNSSKITSPIITSGGNNSEPLGSTWNGSADH